MCLREPISVCRRVESRLARSGSITVWVVVMRVGPGGSELQMISTFASVAGSRKPVLGFTGRIVLTESDSAWKSSGTVACRIDIEVRLLRVVMKSSFTVLSFFRCATSFFAVCGAFSSSEKSMFHLV